MKQPSQLGQSIKGLAIVLGFMLGMIFVILGITALLNPILWQDLALRFLGIAGWFVGAFLIISGLLYLGMSHAKKPRD